MKKSILAAIGMTLCLSLSNIIDVSASGVIDERFPEFTVLPTVVMPGDNSVHFVSNSHTVTGTRVKSFATFVSDAEYNLYDIKAHYPTLPADLMSPVVQAELQENDNLVINTDTPQSVVAVMASEASSMLYYVIEFWDGTVEVQKVSYQNCLEEAGGKFSGLECRLSMKDDEPTYKAYVDGVEVSPEVNPVLSEDVISEEDVKQDDAPDAAVVSGKGDDTDGVMPKTTSAANSIDKNVKNTKTDEEALSTGTQVVDLPSDVLPPSGTPPQPEIGTTASAAHESYEWWALLPLAVIIIGLSIFFSVKRKRIAESRA